MSKINVSKIIKDTQKSIIKHSPEILTGLGITGMIGTTVMGIKATPKALRLMDEAKCEKGDELTVVETVKTTWICYVPTVVTGALSIACIVGASSVNNRRNAALATAYAMTRTTLKEYEEKVVETVGEKKEQLIKDKVAKSKLEQNPVSNNEVFITSKGEALCYDVHSGRYFKSDVDKIRRVQNDLNERLLSEHHISLNEFYYEIGLPCNGAGNDLGWNIEDGQIKILFSSQLAEDNTPCLVIDYLVAPRYNYTDLL